MYEKDKEHQMK